MYKTGEIFGAITTVAEAVGAKWSFTPKDKPEGTPTYDPKRGFYVPCFTSAHFYLSESPEIKSQESSVLASAEGEEITSFTHELLHYMVATDEERRLPNYGLPNSTSNVTAKSTWPRYAQVAIEIAVGILELYLHRMWYPAKPCTIPLFFYNDYIVGYIAEGTAPLVSERLAKVKLEHIETLIAPVKSQYAPEKDTFIKALSRWQGYDNGCRKAYVKLLQDMAPEYLQLPKRLAWKSHSHLS